MRKTILKHSIKPGLRTILCPVVILCASCEPPPCQCPPPEPVFCPTPGQIQLNQLDPGARKRLKDELRSEIQDEMRAQWRKEYEAEIRLNATEKTQNIPAAPPSGEPGPKLVVPQKFATPLPPTQKVERDDGGLKILKIALATGVIKRQPVDERNVFEIGDKSIYCYTEIFAPREEERTITLRFTHSTGLSQSYTLPINQSPAWRTWSKLNLTRSMTGNWLCEIFNEDATLLASRPFTVVN